MKERPILFSTSMVQAILEGRKTQTRRVFKPQPIYKNDVWFFGNDEVFYSDESLQDHLFNNVYGENGSPYGSVYGDGISDRLWVRETWQAQNLYGQWWHEVPKDERELHNWAIIDKSTPDDDLPMPPKWIPSIFMPRWASRITLAVKDVRVERVQDISGPDCWSEGITHDCEKYGSVTHTFAALWDSINLKRGYGWSINPWVWVIEFEVIK